LRWDQYLGFTDTSVSTKRYWQNAVTFLKHPDNCTRKHNEASQVSYLQQT